MDTRPALHPRNPGVTPLARVALVATSTRRRAAAAHGQRIALATQHLLTLGHRRILLVTAQQRPAAEADAELQAHCQVMLAEGLALLPRLELDPAAPACWPELAATLIGIAPTALLCTQPALARALQTALTPQGELTIVGPETKAGALNASWH